MVFKDPAEKVKGRRFKTSHSEPFESYGPPKINLVASSFASPTTNAVFDSEDGRFRSRKQEYSETRRKVGLENRGSKWTPDHGKGSLAPVQDKGM